MSALAALAPGRYGRLFDALAIAYAAKLSQGAHMSSTFYGFTHEERGAVLAAFAAVTQAQRECAPGGAAPLGGVRLGGVGGVGNFQPGLAECRVSPRPSVSVPRGCSILAGHRVQADTPSVAA